ncbi:hypothetical protein [Ottowia testudinis]|uniref:Uncharacterized protein n=1 Tax=Ottowia testudinis TaxID=2816950 RepID=A0A975H2X8_9BURK|nr:hypothetical protein [Ottowia testudinis]QTD45318.1 hypothetical protein J1M35_20275 [Ottowia testudinis]
MNIISKLIEDALWKLSQNESELACINLCILIDAAAKRRYPAEESNKARYTKFLNDEMSTIWFMATEGNFVPHDDIYVTYDSKSTKLSTAFYELFRCNGLHEGYFPIDFRSRDHQDIPAITENLLPAMYAGILTTQEFKGINIKSPVSVELNGRKILFSTIVGDRGLLMQQAEWQTRFDECQATMSEFIKNRKILFLNPL